MGREDSRRVEESFAAGDFEKAARRAARISRGASLTPSQWRTIGRIALLKNHLDWAEHSFSAALECGDPRKVASIQLDRLTVHNVPVHIQPLSHLRGIAGRRRIHGIIGTVLLYHFASTIDYLGARLVLRPRDSRVFFVRNGATSTVARVPFWMDRDHFIVARALVNGRSVLLFIDSGLASGGFACPPSTLAEAGIPMPDGPVVRGQGGGGTVEARRFVVDRISLGRAQQRNVVGWSGVFPPFLEHEFGYRIGGLVSHGFLRNFRVTFDFSIMQITLER